MGKRKDSDNDKRHSQTRRGKREKKELATGWFKALRHADTPKKRYYTADVSVYV